ncbi:MAG TPA: hypothetical protein PLO89_06215 [Spirochaetota bacterium]|nr:hypothetical protein [Spirochaetota bacterium]
MQENNRLNFDSKSLHLRFTIFIFTSLVHILILPSVFYSFIFIFLLTVDLVFYFVYRFKFVVFLRFLFIFLFIFILNLFFYDGRIIFDFYIFKISDNGLINSAKRTFLFSSLFLLSINLLGEAKDTIILLTDKKFKNNLLTNSIKYFFYFFDILKSGKITLRRIFIYLFRAQRGVLSENKEFNCDPDVFKVRIYYNLISILFFIGLIFIQIFFVQKNIDSF